MKLVDTHCHIHSSGYVLNPDEVIRAAALAGVTHVMCVGTDLKDSQLAIDFVQERDSCFASVGIHPHETKHYASNKNVLEELGVLVTAPKVVAVGECGLDYYYNHSSKQDQAAVLRFQLELAKKHDLPVIFHVREAFSDFWPIFDEFAPLRGVVHSFTDTRAVLEQALSRGLLIGLNGITTFGGNQKQLEIAKAVPQNMLLFETDAPYLTPVPFRGTINEPKYVQVVAEFLAHLRSEPLGELAKVTTRNARGLFNLT